MIDQTAAESFIAAFKKAVEVINEVFEKIVEVVKRVIEIFKSLSHLFGKLLLMNAGLKIVNRRGRNKLVLIHGRWL